MILNTFIPILIVFGYFRSHVYAQGCTPSNFCGANGSCSIVNGSQTCFCNDGYVGSKCQLEDPCKITTCNAHGACYPVLSSVLVGVEQVEKVVSLCQCYTGFTGANCQNVGPKPCDGNPCYNGGKCVTKPNNWDFYCDCVGPYTGLTCGSYIDYCELNRCENGGLCEPDTVNKSYSCKCLSGFLGDFCQDEIDECAEPGPCKNNGTCYDLIDAYYCDCNGPFGGPTCDIYIDPCKINPCGPGAICLSDGGADYTCKCAVNFFGKPCQQSPCVSNPCKQVGSTCLPVEANAIVITGGSGLPAGVTCTNKSATYVCVCPSSDFASVLC